MDATRLFSAEIATCIDEVYTRGVKLMNTHKLLQGTALPVGEERDHVTAENARQTIRPQTGSHVSGKDSSDILI